MLRRLGMDWAAEPGFLPWPLPAVIPLSRKSSRDWWVGEQLVSFQGTDDQFPVDGVWTSDSNVRDAGRCPEVAAAVIVHCWNLPEWRSMFDLPEWELELHDVIVDQDPDGDKLPFGRVRYTLLDDGKALRRGVPIERELIRWSRTDGRALRPRKLIDDGSAIRLDASCITPQDQAIHDLLAALRFWNRSALQLPGNKVEDFRRKLAARVFDQLLEVDELWFGDTRLTVDTTPLFPTLVATRGADRELELSWEPIVHHLIDIGGGYAVCGHGVFRPLVDVRLAQMNDRFLKPLPTVPLKELKSFIDRVVLKSSLPCDLRGQDMPKILSVGNVIGQIRLVEDDDFLCLDAEYVYRNADAETKVLGSDTFSQFRLGADLARRNPRAERRLKDEARQILGISLPARLEGDIAYQVLLDRLPRLPENWRVDAGDSLVKFRVSGQLKTKVTIPSGIDWLDLKVEFMFGDESVDVKAVLKSWRQGERFHHLDDGTLVRLPENWLQRHGVVQEELEAIRDANEGRIPDYAAPMLEALIEEAEGDSSRWETCLNELEEASAVPQRPTPDGLNAELRAYQKAGFLWLAWLRDRGFGGVLADDMGLGKTIQALTLLLDEHRTEGPPSLVVAPTSVIYAWAEEAQRFVPSLKVAVFHGPSRPETPPDDVDLVVTSYGLLRHASEAFNRPWRVLVLDEAQRIKNPESHVAKVTRGINARFRFALTGTPLENRLLELWSIFECLMPGFFGPRAAFRRRYSIPIERERDEEALERLQRRIRPFVLRRLKGEVATELPPRQEVVLYCELGPKQRQLYDRVRYTYRDSVLRRVSEVGVGRSTLPVLEALMRLRQACCHPGLLPFPEAADVEESAKFNLLVETLDKTVPAGHRTLIFSQWTALLKRVIPRLEENGWDFLYLDGRTTKRHELVKQWNEPTGPPVFLISLRAGGTGLNLTGADHVIHLDPWWNPAVEDQATDRAHRIGQVKPVVAYRFVARNTVEEKVLALQERKRALFDMTVQQGRFPVEQLTRADLEDFFTVDGPGSTADGSVTLEETSVGLSGAADALHMLFSDGRAIDAKDVMAVTDWPADEAEAWLKAQADAGLLIPDQPNTGKASYVRA
ncbi:MAG: SNF2-related protein [Myxococcota bacterium]|nr:SNF2-related protein [Myxococcota bacterium]